MPDTLWAVAAFLVCAIYFASTQPVAPAEAVGGEGQALHAMAKALPRELVPVSAPYGSRIGVPLAVAAVAKSLDWVISAGFDRVNFVCNLLSVVLLAGWLRSQVRGRAIRLALVVLFIVEPHSPIRLSYVHPISTAPATMAFLLAGLVGIQWFDRRPNARRAGALAVLVAIGVLVHEGVLLIGVCLLMANAGRTSRVSWRERLAAIDRSGAWLPVCAGAMMLAAVYAWVEPVPSSYSRVQAGLELLGGTSPHRYLLSWFLVYGALLMVPIAMWRHSARLLLRRPLLLLFLAACAAGALISTTQFERSIALASPVVLLLAGRTLTALPAATTLTAAVVLLQLVSSRVFTAVGGPIETPVVLGEVWERVISARFTWALSYQNLWGQSCAPEVLAGYAMWFAVCAVILLIASRWTGGLWLVATASSPMLAATPDRFLHSTTIRWFAIVLGIVAGVAPIAWLSGGAVYARLYAEPGIINVAYNAARVWLIIALVLVFWSTGTRAIARWSTPADSLTGFLDATFAGAAIWSLAIVAIAAAHLYYSLLVLVLFSVALVVALFDVSRRVTTAAVRAAPVAWSLPTVALGAIVLVHVGAILLGIVLWGHPGGDNDVPGNYLPYYDTVLQRHSIAPNQYWVHFFASKGNGLGLLANALSDVQGAGLATFAVMLMGGALIGRLALGSGVPAGIALLLVAVYLQFFGAQGAYAKAHIIRNTFIVYLVISSAQWLWSGREGRLSVVTRLPVIAAVVVLSPLAALILLPVVAVPGLIALLAGQPPMRRTLLEPAWTIGVAMLVCAYNYLQVGLIELHSMPSAVGRLVDFRRLSQWLDPKLAYMDYRLGFVQSALPSLSGAPASIGMPPTEPVLKVLSLLLAPATVVAVGAGVLAMIVTARRWNRDHDLPRAGLALLSLLTALGVVAAFRLFGAGPDSSMGRFTSFADPLALALAAIMAVTAWRMSEFGGRVAIGALLFATGGAALLTGWQPVAALPWRASVAFAMGRTSYAAMHEPAWGTLTASRIASQLPDGARVEMVSFLPGFTGIPHTPFQRPDGAVYLPRYTTVLHASADAAAQLYAEHGIQYFLFDVTPGTTTVWSGFGELLAPANIRARMRVVSHIESSGYDVYLTTWRDGREPPDAAVETLASRWAEKLAVEKTEGLYYSTFVATRGDVAGY